MKGDVMEMVCIVVSVYGCVIFIELRCYRINCRYLEVTGGALLSVVLRMCLL